MKDSTNQSKLSPYFDSQLKKKIRYNIILKNFLEITLWSMLKTFSILAESFVGFFSVTELKKEIKD
ncbi:MAG: hypothetical protein ISS16_00385 [Ignavibacteria bacterium]|nr:hypothetical protein [Ignavibacteria bacterium]